MKEEWGRGGGGKEGRKPISGNNPENFTNGMLLPVPKQSISRCANIGIYIYIHELVYYGKYHGPVT